MAGERSEKSPKLRTDDAVHWRQLFERLWPVDRTPVFGGLVRAIDQFDRDQSRRRKHGGAADTSD